MPTCGFTENINTVFGHFKKILLHANTVQTVQYEHRKTSNKIKFKVRVAGIPMHDTAYQWDGKMYESLSFTNFCDAFLKSRQRSKKEVIDLQTATRHHIDVMSDSEKTRMGILDFILKQRFIKGGASEAFRIKTADLKRTLFKDSSAIGSRVIIPNQDPKGRWLDITCPEGWSYSDIPNDLEKNLLQPLTTMAKSGGFVFPLKFIRSK